MDIVYLVKTEPNNDSSDLRYSLRSLKNVTNKNKVFIVGEKPSWIKGVEYISVPQTKTKKQNWSMNLAAAVTSSAISDDFVMMNDDFFIMKPVSKIPDLNFGLMADVIHKYENRYPDSSEYIERMRNLYDLLIEQGHVQPLSYELHVPMVINKKKVLDLYRERAGRPMYQFRSYYGNYFKLGGETIDDVKVFLDSSHNSAEYSLDPKGYLSSQTFLSTTGGSSERGFVGEFIRDALPNKSKFEI